jgi:hypothetical protein
MVQHGEYCLALACPAFLARRRYLTKIMNQFIRQILLILTGIGWLTVTGCVFSGHGNHPAVDDQDNHQAGVDHSEHPGDMEHDDDR